MAQPVSPVCLYPPTLFDALKAEGFVLPDECVDVALELPAEGAVVLTLRVRLTPLTLGKISRALQRVADTT